MGENDLGFWRGWLLGDLFAQWFGVRLSNIVELGPANFCGSNQFQFGNNWRVDRKNTFDSYAVTNLANSKCRVWTGAMLVSDDQTFKNLEAFFAAFFNFLVHPDGLARADIDTRKFGHNGGRKLSHHTLPERLTEVKDIVDRI